MRDSLLWFSAVVCLLFVAGAMPVFAAGPLATGGRINQGNTSCSDAAGLFTVSSLFATQAPTPEPADRPDSLEFLAARGV